MTFASSSVGRCASWFLGAALIGTALSACDARSDGKAFDRAQAAMARGDYPTARVELMNAAKDRANDPTVAVAMAETLLELGDWVGASASIADARRLGSRDPRLIGMDGDAAILAGDAAKAEQIAAAIPEAHSADAARIAGGALVLRGKLDEALARFNDALATSPNDARLHIEAGFVAVALNQRDEATAHAERAMALAPRRVGSHLLRAQVAEFNDDRAGALAAYDQALSVRPDNVRAMLGRAATLGDLGRVAAMRDTLDMVDQHYPGNLQALYLRAKLTANAGDLDAAQSLLASAGSQLDDHVPALVLSAQLADRAGRSALAVSRMRQAIMAAPGELHLSFLLADMLARHGQQQEAEAALGPFARLAEEPAEVSELRARMASR